MKIKMKVQEYRDEEVEITFPVFFHYAIDTDNGYYSDTYIRYEQNGTETQITKDNDGKWEFGTDQNNLNYEIGCYNGLGYHLSKKTRQITKEEFDKKIKELIAAVLKLQAGE